VSDAAPLTVLYIGGYGRSGSTVLDRVLGELPGVVSVGEMRSLWGAVLRGDRRCSCGRSFGSCPFWSAVGERAFGGWETEEVRRGVEARRAIDRHRHLPRLVVGRRTAAFDGDLAVFRALTARLYLAVADVAQAEVVVDASKYPVYAAILRGTPGLDLRVLHLVRDARGTAHSWAKQGVVKPDAEDGETMPIYRPSRAALEWSAYNLAFDLAGVGRLPVRRLRYESLVRDPVGTVRRIAAFAGVPVTADDLAFLDGEHVRLGEQHAIGGNPARFADGASMRLRLDDAWRGEMPARARRTVTALASPLLLRYGYLGSRGA
jgi:Sulfotransferase family